MVLKPKRTGWEFLMKMDLKLVVLEVFVRPKSNMTNWPNLILLGRVGMLTSIFGGLFAILRTQMLFPGGVLCLILVLGFVDLNTFGTISFWKTIPFHSYRMWVILRVPGCFGVTLKRTLRISLGSKWIFCFS